MRLLRKLLLALLLSLGIGLLIGTWIRLRLERPVRYIGSHPPAAAPYFRPVHSTSGTPARAFSSRAITKSRSESRFR